MRRYIIPLILITASFSLASCNFNVEMPKGYALVYGISDYDGEGADLYFCDDDAIDMAALLQQRRYQVILRTDSAVTRGTIESDIADMKLQVDKNSTFLFFYSGHGSTFNLGTEPLISDSLQEWILPYDSIDASGSITSATLQYAISDDDLSELLNTIDTPRKIVIMDSCNSGGFIGDSADVDGVPGDYTGELDTGLFSEAFDLYLRFPDSTGADIPANEAIVLSAAGEQEASWEAGGYGHGIFTYFFLEAATNGDLDEDGYITLLEAYAYTVAGIEQYWNPLGSSSSFHPHISGGPVDFLLFKADP